jgi:hypothetical protein
MTAEILAAPSFLRRVDAAHYLQMKFGLLREADAGQTRRHRRRAQISPSWEDPALRPR